MKVLIYYGIEINFFANVFSLCPFHNVFEVNFNGAFSSIMGINVVPKSFFCAYRSFLLCDAEVPFI